MLSSKKQIVFNLPFTSLPYSSRALPPNRLVPRLTAIVRRPPWSLMFHIESSLKHIFSRSSAVEKSRGGAKINAMAMCDGGGVVFNGPLTRLSCKFRPKKEERGACERRQSVQKCRSASESDNISFILVIPYSGFLLEQ